MQKKKAYKEIPNLLNESSRFFQNQWTGDLKSMTILEKMFVFKECILSLVLKKRHIFAAPVNIYYICYDLASEQRNSIMFDSIILI